MAESQLKAREQLHGRCGALSSPVSALAVIGAEIGTLEPSLKSNVLF
jgi:hypothetical protein